MDFKVFSLYFVVALISYYGPKSTTMANTSPSKEAHAFAEAQTKEILYLMPYGSPSHLISVLPLLEGLAAKGYRITYVSIIKMFVKIPGATEIHLADVEAIHEANRPDELAFKSMPFGMIRNMTKLNAEMCRKILNDTRIKDLLQTKGRFSIALIDGLLSDCAFSLIYKLGIPHITLCTTSLYNFLAWDLYVPSPYSYVPHFLTGLRDEMTSFERVKNTVSSLVFLAFQSYFLKPTQKVVNEFHKDVPSLTSIGANASLVLVNSHPSIDFVRPSMPYVIEIGGMHCRYGKPLPKDLETFIDGGKDGFIFFSLGTNVRGSTLSQAKARMFLNAFGLLKQRVIWKFDREYPDLPENVKIVKWAPQQDLLANPAIKIFVTHMGQLSSHEAIYHATPVIGIPVYGDQLGNTANFVKKGLGEALDLEFVTSKIIYDTFQKLITNNSYYRHNALKYSRLFRDRPQPIADTAVYWVEYAIRHGGAPHFRGAAEKLNFFQYFLIDVVVFLAVCICISGVVLVKIFKMLARMCCKEQEKEEPKGKRRKKD